MRAALMTRTIGRAAVFGVLCILLGACSETYPNLSSLAPAKKKFTATLIGANEVPAVSTSAAGAMELIQEDSVNILYTITTTATTDSITMAHIHAGAAGAAGPIMVWFFPTEASRAAGTGGGTAASVNGVLRVGRITRAGTTFVGVYTWDSLLVRMNAGTAYANIHTRKNGGGEIRGQVTPVP
jgi:CHRD domain